ncbi:helix-turn-helix domain-containing protein [Flavobacterium sp. '19STA2R22 D10 B1']|uniref:helix-turn-helix domain-containing protein n=1 Tax=Flavobacterium aerium TaxID=3037261 RepID=UPI00278C20E0|nr:AraC family transcriptional regulator [Flavobacterium sp. '19STA2R22 D10 B1']
MNIIKVLDIEQFRQEDQNHDFYANTFIDHLEHYHKSISVPHKHNFFVTVLFTKGSGVHEIDFNAYPIQPGSVFMLNPGQTHHWEFSADTDGYIFLHSQSFYDLYFSHQSIHNFPFFYSTQNPPCLYLKDHEIEKTTILFQNILAEFNSDQVLKNQKLCSLTDITYIELTRLYLDEQLPKLVKFNNYSDKLQKLEELIEEHFITEKSPSQYADWMNMSPKHLNRITKTLLGKTTSELITERVLLEAKRLLIHSKNSFTNIALTLGYDDYSYFSKLFKNKCNETPSEFSKKYLSHTT